MKYPEWMTQWRMAGKYGTRGDLIGETVRGSWEQFWLCRVRGQHREKFGSYGACYRCAKAMR